MLAEVEDAAVIAAVEHHDVTALREHARGHHCEQVGLGAGIAKAHEINRGEAIAHQTSELSLIDVRPAQRHAAVDHLLERGHDLCVRVAVEASRIFTEEVHVGVSVDVRHAATLATVERQRERRIVQHRACISTRHARLGTFGSGTAFRVYRDETRLRIGDSAGEVSVRLQAGQGHWRLFHFDRSGRCEPACYGRGKVATSILLPSRSRMNAQW